ncbi:MAG: molecular chaperone HtpG [Bacilli bacterium]|jgi:molecular chaperone HtpG|nr:molecular chaperone HtpG [Bacilli bacterium]
MKKEFKAESKQLLELMINSIYSNKEIFLRELISNASDAIDKRKFLALKNKELEIVDPSIKIEVDKKARTISLIDTGVGMNEQELEEYLGTIAHSGSKEFMQALENNSVEVIGQFGVGFYSSFIVSDKVEVYSKKYNEAPYHWVSEGISDYEIAKSTSNQEIGTRIILHLKKGKDYDVFLEENELEKLVKKYSDYIKYPILMNKEIKVYDTDEDGNEVHDKYTITNELQTINSQEAIWKRPKNKVKAEEYDNFYMSHFHDWQKPLKTIYRKAEGTLNYEMLLFIPSHRGFDFFSPTYQEQMDLYSKSVFIESNCDYLISYPFRFIKGIVDSEDLSLNISREMLQQDKNVTKLAKAIESRIKSELLKMQKDQREDYNKFYDEFGQQLVYGIYDNYGVKKELLQDLIMFKSSKTKEYLTLKEYVTNNSDASEILYVAGKDISVIDKLPVMEQIISNEKEVLYFLNDVDEFAIGILNEYEGKTFKNIASADYEDESSKEDIASKSKANEDLLSQLKEVLKDEVSDVVLTSRLKSNPVYLASKDGLSIEMEKTLAQMPDNMGMKATKVLEINPDHELFKAMNKLYDSNKDDLNDYAKLLYNQALLIEGLPIENPVEYSSLLTKLMIKASNK